MACDLVVPKSEVNKGMRALSSEMCHVLLRIIISLKNAFKTISSVPVTIL
jgi:hypothetical protein